MIPRQRIAERSFTIGNGVSAAGEHVKDNILQGRPDKEWVYPPCQDERSLKIGYGEIVFTRVKKTGVSMQTDPVTQSVLNGVVVNKVQRLNTESDEAYYRRHVDEIWKNIRILGVSPKDVPFNNGAGRDPLDPPTYILHGHITMPNTSTQTIKAGNLIVAALPNPTSRSNNSTRHPSQSAEGLDKRLVLETMPLPKIQELLTQEDKQQLLSYGIDAAQIPNIELVYRSRLNSLFERIIGVATSDAPAGQRFECMVQPAFSI